MNTIFSDTNLYKQIIEAAHEAFSGLKNFYSVLYPIEYIENYISVNKINREAGSHPMPNNEREIRAALSASDLTWRLFPYFKMRYGSRGKRFSDSDSCWLVTLTNYDWKFIESQVQWLCCLLANRGMPTIMIEEMLKNLHKKLVETVPEKKTSYDKLLISIEMLRERRFSCIPNSKFKSLSQEFIEMVGSPLTEQYKNFGPLLISAVVDKKLGTMESIASIRDWSTDSNRFPKKWINAVITTINEAEKAAII
jgi:hypothetical protein